MQSLYQEIFKFELLDGVEEGLNNNINDINRLKAL